MSGPINRGRAGVAPVVVLGAFLLAFLVGCRGPILANPALPLASPATPSAIESQVADPVPVVLPRDDGPHDRLTEWWYYTGHLVAADGRHFGFEAVIFRAERGDAPVTWASHLAVTDEAGHRFLYVQRAEVGPQVDRSPRNASGAPTGFDLDISGFDAAAPTTSAATPPAWELAGSNGNDHITTALAPAEAQRAGVGFGLSLDLTAQKTPALHFGNGWVDFGPAGGSYYYSRTRMATTGTLTLDGDPIAVTGEAWFDHQWGDFISVGGGGWDWFAVELADGTDLTISLVRSVDGSYPLVYGTLVDAAGHATHLDRTAFSVRPAGSWTSPLTGSIYPAGWHLEIPRQGLVIDLVPTVADQELDTRPTTGVVYWEGSQRVSATRDGRAVGGEAYVELTGYGPR